MSKIPHQTDMIHKTDWDVLMIFDACRFDCFEKQYPKYLKGKLTKVESPGVNTKQWMVNTWREKYDITYISAMPYINGMGFPFAKWKATDHFKEIIDVWTWGFDEDIGWIPPSSVNEATELALKKQKKRVLVDGEYVEVDTDLGEKFVLHYVQPHKPYIGKTNIYTIRDKHALRDKMMGVEKPLTRRATGPKANSKDEAHQNLFKAYKETLDLVLEKAVELIRWLPGKVVISADHGELMGENGRWGGHLRGPRVPALFHVPWFEVEGIV